MHVPDHFLDPTASAVTAAVALVSVGALMVRARRTPMSMGSVAGVSALVAALQMVNVPVFDGVSGHLLGSVLAVAILGPAWGTISMVAIVASQAIFLGDGGVLALGTNIVVIALVPSIVASAGLGIARRHGAGVATASSAVLAAVSVFAAAATLALLWLSSGTVSVPPGEIVGELLRVHSRIAFGEGLFTAALLFLAHRLAPDGMWISTAKARRPQCWRERVLAAGFGGCAVAIVLLSQHASSAPDGFEHVAMVHGYVPAEAWRLLAGSTSQELLLSLFALALLLALIRRTVGTPRLA